MADERLLPIELAEEMEASYIDYAMSTIMSISGTSDREPLKHGGFQAQYEGGLNGAGATTMALFHQSMTGEGQHLGQHLEIAMLDATISFVWPEGFVRQILVGGEVAHGRPGAAPERSLTAAHPQT